MSFLLLAIGFALLIKGADLLVDSASKLAKMFGIPGFIIGLSVVAFGTSAPEAVIGVLSGISRSNQITLGNAIGSSIYNIAVIVGITSVIFPINVSGEISKKEIPFSLGIQVLLLMLTLFGAVVSRTDGLILLSIFILFLYYIFKSMRAVSDSNAEIQKTGFFEDSTTVGNYTKSYVIKLIVLLLTGMAGLFVGGNMVVENSRKIAEMFGLSKTLIGLTVVTFGTSLPELVTCIVTAVRREMDIAIGNIVGSNIFNITFVLGISAVLNPIPAPGTVNPDIAVMVFTTVLLLLMALLKKSVSRLGGLVFILYYISYITFKIITIGT